MKNADDALREIYRLLEEWRHLTQAETDSIRSEDWASLESLQTKKASLQRSIGAQENAVFRSSALSEERKASERRNLRKIAAELLSLEQKNQESLAVRLAEADQELKDSDKTIRSLRHVQQAYGRTGHSFWQAYS